MININILLSNNENCEKIDESRVLAIEAEAEKEFENVPTNRYVKWIILGGDVFQPSFVGDICEVRIYNEAKDCEYIKRLYHKYVSDDRFLHKEGRL